MGATLDDASNLQAGYHLRSVLAYDENAGPLHPAILLQQKIRLLRPGRLGCRDPAVFSIGAAVVTKTLPQQAPCS